jgi:hypothetical protein
MTDDPRARLEALREHFAARLPEAADRDATAIGRLLKDIDADLAKMPNRAEVSDADEIAARRAVRRSGAKSPTRAKRSS